MMYLKYLLLAILAIQCVQSKPQGSLRESGTDILRAAGQAIYEACPCFDYEKMCAQPPSTEQPEATTLEPEVPTTLPPEPKSDDETPTTTTAPVPEAYSQDPQASSSETPTTAVPEEQATPEALADAQPSPTTPAASVEEIVPTTQSTDGAETEAPVAVPDEQPVPTEVPTETLEEPKPQDAPPEDSQRLPKKLDEAPANLANDPAADPNNQVAPPAQGVDPNALDQLTKLLAELNAKLAKLEKSHDKLNQHIDELENKLKEYEKLIPEVKNGTARALESSDPEQAVEQWKNLQTIIEDPQELQNVTNDIVTNACEKNVPPTDTMNFIHNLPTDDKNLQASAYNTLADNMVNSEPLQEQMYWKDMTPYCQAVASDIGQNTPTTQKMYDLQNQMRLNAAQPIRNCSQQINQQQYDPAVDTWITMTIDIADNPNQLKNNMQKLVLKSYDGNPESLPYVFQFVFVLPENQVDYKDVAYECLRNEMNANGHSFIYQPTAQGGNQQQQQQPPRDVYNYQSHY